MYTILAKNLIKSFKNFIPVNDASITVKEGEIFGILGPSGSGKSTILKLIVGLLEPDSGFVRILNFNPQKQKKECMQSIGIVPQHDPLYKELTVWENIELFGILYGLSPGQVKKAGEELMELTRMEEKRNDLVETLSGGEKKRVNVMLAMLHKPKILLLDEPTSGLDPISKKIVWQIVKQAKAEKTTVVIITHLMEEAEYLCDRIAILDKGQIKKLGSKNELIKELRLEAYIYLKTAPGFQKNFRMVEKSVLRAKIAERVEILKNGIKLIGMEPKAMDTVMKYLERRGERIVEIQQKEPTMEDIFIQATRSKSVYRGEGI